MKQRRSVGRKGRQRPARRRTALRQTMRYRMKIALIAIIVIAVVIGILFAPVGLELLGKENRNWTLLGNVGQAYGGISAVISALALIGVIGTLLIQAHQHTLDRMTAVRGRQAQIYSVIREDPLLYGQVLGYSGEESAVRRRTFRIELLQYYSMGFETGLLTGAVLRSDVFAGFFRYEENRQFWEMVNSEWLTATSGRKRRKFVRIANEELAYAKSTGPGLPVSPPPSESGEASLNRKSGWQRPTLAGATAAAGIVFLLSRRRFGQQSYRRRPSRKGRRA